MRPIVPFRRLAPAAIAAAALLGASAVTPAVAAPARTAGAAARPHGWPVVKLYAPQLSEKVAVFGGKNSFSFIDPSIYVETLGSALQFNVQRKTLTSPRTITQVIRYGGTVQRRTLGRWATNGWKGLRRFVKLTIKTAGGKVIASRTMTFCPDSYGPQRTNPLSAAKSPYPYSCTYNTPFLLSGVWGIARGWGVDPMTSGFFFSPFTAKLQAGHNYWATMTITPRWRAVLRIAPQDAKATVKIEAVTPQQCNPCVYRAPARHAAPASLARQFHETAASMQRVPQMTNPPQSVLPDLMPLPSANINVANIRQTPRTKANSQLTFGATVAVLGNGPLDVEGFSTHHSSVMPAYQYYFRGNQVVGRTRAGTMGFDNKPGHNHWHFEQFAQYRLLTKNKKLVVRSQKVGFCIAPTDGVDLLLPHATWQLNNLGFGGGACGSPGALWVQEHMPVGWGDTYYQYVAGQSFNITHLHNGAYYIEIIANPEHVLHETNTANDTSLREIILGGTFGHRTVRELPFRG